MESFIPRMSCGRLIVCTLACRPHSVDNLRNCPKFTVHSKYVNFPLQDKNIVFHNMCYLSYSQLVANLASDLRVGNPYKKKCPGLIVDLNVILEHDGATEL